MFWKKRKKIDPNSDTAKIVKTGKKGFWKRFSITKSKSKKREDGTVPGSFEIKYEPPADYFSKFTSYSPYGSNGVKDEIKESQKDKIIKNPYDLKSHEAGFPSQSQHSAKWDHNENIDSKRKKPDSGE